MDKTLVEFVWEGATLATMEPNAAGMMPQIGEKIAVGVRVFTVEGVTWFIDQKPLRISIYLKEKV